MDVSDDSSTRESEAREGEVSVSTVAPNSKCRRCAEGEVTVMSIESSENETTIDQQPSMQRKRHHNCLHLSEQGDSKKLKQPMTSTHSPAEGIAPSASVSAAEESMVSANAIGDECIKIGEEDAPDQLLPTTNHSHAKTAEVCSTPRGFHQTCQRRQREKVTSLVR